MTPAAAHACSSLSRRTVTMPIDPIVRAVDDDRRFLEALARNLRVSGLAVVTYPSARAFLDDFDPGQPGCLLTDLRMPDMDGLKLQRTMRERRMYLPILFVTGHGDVAAAVDALKAGAFDFLEKPIREKRLLDSVAQALEQDARNRELYREKAVVTERYACLSPRERQVLQLVVSDLSNKEVARQLRISPRTVEHHRDRVMLKMQAHSLTELITMAVLCGAHELHL
ncbi:response regulator transcription factor [Spectribacter hydrogenooxidans]|uniref:Response regulator n=1 Tax=Spectribacter hydrogenoxidans TaxID=3075608 RepID=A0ABU3C4L0_9GAMM|nr:response regulator [Salinisphaera sp. W335]MDT0636274.1 response regulator [Salinisphaera sp. W335]